MNECAIWLVSDKFTRCFTTEAFRGVCKGQGALAPNGCMVVHN